MSKNIDQIFLQAFRDHKDGKIIEAERLYKDILQTNPTHPDANHNLGILKMSFNKISESLILFKTAIDSNSKVDQYWVSYANAQASKELYKDSEESFKKALSINPYLFVTHCNLGVVQIKLKKLDDAELSFKKAIEIKTDYVDAHYNLGILLKTQDRLDEAELSYKKALSFNSNDNLKKNIIGSYGELLLQLNKHNIGLKFITEGHGVIVFSKKNLKII